MNTGVDGRRREIQRTAQADIYLSTLLPARLLYSMMDMALVWLVITFFHMLLDPDVTPFSMVGIIYISSGLMFFIQIFGVMNHLTRHAIFQRKIKKAIRAGRDYKLPAKTIFNVRWGTNGFWFVVHLGLSFYTLELMKMIADSISAAGG
ncbi:MAG: hypothetical protein EA357_03840 [Micavibrio sp.]|nr:MAG: hypothetical protein EA357_03840 [Micavibrio sp.]